MKFWEALREMQEHGAHVVFTNSHYEGRSLCWRGSRIYAGEGFDWDIDYTTINADFTVGPGGAVATTPRLCYVEGNKYPIALLAHPEGIPLKARCSCGEEVDITGMLPKA